MAMLKALDRAHRFLDDGRICLSNNAAEWAVRGIALGRKLWPFYGSDRGGERAAVVYGLIVCQDERCRSSGMARRRFWPASWNVPFNSGSEVRLLDEARRQRNTPEDQEQCAQELLEPAQEQAEVVSGGSERGVDAVAVAALEVADHGLDRGATAHLAADDLGDTTRVGLDGCDRGSPCHHGCGGPRHQ
jgi:hypothetical protein